MLVCEEKSALLNVDDADKEQIFNDGHLKRRAFLWRWSTTIALMISVLSNVGWFWSTFSLCRSADERFATETAGLVWNIPSKFHSASAFNHPDRAIQDAAWASEMMKPWRFAVAIDDSDAEARGLQRAMRWPWDESKGVYVLNTGHQLHCLNMLRRSIHAHQDGSPPLWEREHLLHCIEVLLQDVVCYADDTLLYTGLVAEQRNFTEGAAGIGTPRQCRDWTKLRAWADAHSACYNPHIGEDDPAFPEVERYRECPPSGLVHEDVWTWNAF